MEHFRPGCAASVTATTVEIAVSCRNLLDMDVFSKSDPVCVLFCRDDFGSGNWFEFGRTEVIDNNLNPDFVKKFVLSYFFEERQQLRFMLYDVDSNVRDLSQHDYLGKYECSLGEIVSTGKIEKRLDGPKSDAGSIILTAEEQSTCKEEVTLQFSGKKLDKKDWFGKSDPFLAFYKVNEDGSFTVAHRTEVIKNTLNPTWKPFTVPVRALCGGDYDRSILVRCIDWNRDGSEDLIGELTTSLTELIKGPGPVNTYELDTKQSSDVIRGNLVRFQRKVQSRLIKLLNPSKGHKKKPKFAGHINLLNFSKQQMFTFVDYIQTGWVKLLNPKKKMERERRKKKEKSSGRVEVLMCRVVTVPTFLDYVIGGTELNCTIAIDFTASNGNPQQPSSLHYIHPHQPNQYASALQAVGQIIQDYDSELTKCLIRIVVGDDAVTKYFQEKQRFDHFVPLPKLKLKLTVHTFSDHLFPVLGFGARLPPDGRISHEFYVNGSQTNPFCEGIPGVMDAYHRCITQVQLFGPTNFAPVINHVARFAAAKRDGSEYFILLILTDGVITDMPLTKDAIVNASSLPLSIIIVGVGSADFAAMEELDGDDDGEFGRLRSSRGKYAERDIVQFVPFSKFVQGSTAAQIQISQARLAKEVLEEIPDQFVSYMRRNGIVPKPRGQNTRPTSASGIGVSLPQPATGTAPRLDKSDLPPPYPGF